MEASVAKLSAADSPGLAAFNPSISPGTIRGTSGHLVVYQECLLNKKLSQQRLFDYMSMDAENVVIC